MYKTRNAQSFIPPLLRILVTTRRPGSFGTKPSRACPRENPAESQVLLVTVRRLEQLWMLGLMWQGANPANSGTGCLHVNSSRIFLMILLWLDNRKETSHTQPDQAFHPLPSIHPNTLIHPLRIRRSRSPTVSLLTRSADLATPWLLP